MTDTTPAISIEPVAIGDRQSRVSSAIAIILCVIPSLAAVLFGGVDNITWVLLTALCFVVVILWLIETWRGSGFIYSPDTLLLPLAGLFLWGIIQMLPLSQAATRGGLSINASHALSMDPYATRLFLVRLALLILFFAACLTFINTETRLRRIVTVLVLFGSSLAFVGILQKLADPDEIYGGLRVPFAANPFGPFVNQHHFAAFMEMIGGLALGILVGTIPRDKKIVVGVAFTIIVIALILTGSRGGILSFLTLTGVVFLLRGFGRVNKTEENVSNEDTGRVRKLARVIAPLAIVVGIIGSIIFVGGDQSLLRGVGLSTPDEISNGRLHFWSVAWRIFLEHPFFGAGFDAFGVAFTKYDDSNGFFRVLQAHNDYLQMLADGGVIGFCLVMAFIVIFIRKALKTIRTTGRGLRRDIAIGAFAGCCGVLVHSFFDFPLRTWSNSFFFLMLVVIATVSVRTSEENTTRKRRKRRSSAHEPGSLSTRTASRT